MEVWKARCWCSDVEEVEMWRLGGGVATRRYVVVGNDDNSISEEGEAIYMCVPQELGSRAAGV